MNVLSSHRHDIRNWPVSPLCVIERGIRLRYIPTLYEFEFVGITALVDNIVRYHNVEILVVGPNLPRE